MKTTIEEINGKLCTVVRKPFDAEWVKSQLDIGIPVLMDSPKHLPHRHVITAYNEDEFQSSVSSEYGYEFNSARDSWNKESDCRNVLIILPALPRNPKPEDARMLYRYMAEGIDIIWKWGGEIEDDWESITCGLLHNQDGIDLIGDGAVPIAYAINSETGERVEVAIYE